MHRNEMFTVSGFDTAFNQKSQEIRINKKFHRNTVVTKSLRKFSTYDREDIHPSGYATGSNAAHVRTLQKLRLLLYSPAISTPVNPSLNAQ